MINKMKRRAKRNNTWATFERDSWPSPQLIYITYSVTKRKRGKR